jgi:subtilisin-like proprotein convertase family protein
VHVGVYDDGVQYTHPDLSDNYDPSRHVSYDGDVQDGGPSAIGPAGHGTAVAGLIAAEANGKGGVGVAWGAELTGVNVTDWFTSDGSWNPLDFNNLDPVGFYAAVKQSAKFDVVNNSWGPAGWDYDPDQNPNIAGSFTAQTLAGWESAAATGRGGLGTVIVKGAGNADVNCNGDGLDASRFTVSVGALRDNGVTAFYSNYGANLLVSAPADGYGWSDGGKPGLVTTDMLGEPGYNWSSGHTLPSDYTDAFDKTSAATPLVTGVVSLMLDAAPGLGWRDVQNILAASATHTGGAIGASPIPDYEANAWFLNGAGNWNGGGMHFSEDYGYGALDAYNAVRMAEAWHLFTPKAQTSANEMVKSTGKLVAAAAIRDLDSTTFTFDVASPMELDFASLTLSLSKTSVYQLDVYLVSPEGTEVLLSDYSNGWGFGPENLPLTWTYGIEAFRGENPVGTWTVRIEDTQSLGDGEGVLHWVDLDLHGRAVQANDVYHYTNEFGAMSRLAGQSGRTTLADTDGGADWIDAAALSGNATVNLKAGALCALGGGSFRIGAGTAIENCVTGDGNDSLTGNGLANELRGMRGNDQLVCDAGNDQAFGGAGSDRIDGGTGADRIHGGAGKDTLKGGAGMDRFLFDALGDSTTAARDTILDFVRGVDRVDVSAIDPAAAIAGDQAFAWIGTAGFAGAGTAQARYGFSGGNTIVEFDTGSGGAAEMSILLQGALDLAATDFLL